MILNEVHLIKEEDKNEWIQESTIPKIYRIFEAGRFI